VASSSISITYKSPVRQNNIRKYADLWRKVIALDCRVTALDCKVGRAILEGSIHPCKRSMLGMVLAGGGINRAYVRKFSKHSFFNIILVVS
jgi:hypothetical protein